VKNPAAGLPVASSDFSHEKYGRGAAERAACIGWLSPAAGAGTGWLLPFVTFHFRDESQ
jgi:hypothetical protein